jgi:hypothetical protein
MATLEFFEGLTGALLLRPLDWADPFIRYRAIEYRHYNNIQVHGGESSVVVKSRIQQIAYTSP